MGRTPLAEEQRAIAQTQQDRIAAAAATHDVVVADTTAAMIAVYSRYKLNGDYAWGPRFAVFFVPALGLGFAVLLDAWLAAQPTFGDMQALAAADPAAGAAQYATCMACHGPSGEGNPAQIGLDPKVDLTASAMVAGRARGLIYQRISYGYGAMPGFEHKLERGDVELLVDYVLRLAGEE
mgnify:CR=1 FL=1